MKTKQIVQIIAYLIVSAAITGAIIYFTRDQKVDTFREPTKRVRRTEGADGPVASVRKKETVTGTVATISPVLPDGNLDPNVSIMSDWDQDNDVDLRDIAGFFSIPFDVGDMKYCGQSTKGLIRIYSNSCPVPLEAGFEQGQPVKLVTNMSVPWWTQTSGFLTGPK